MNTLGVPMRINPMSLVGQLYAGSARPLPIPMVMVREAMDKDLRTRAQISVGIYLRESMAKAGMTIQPIY